MRCAINHPHYTQPDERKTIRKTKPWIMMLFISKARAFFKKLFYYLCLVYFSCFLPCVKVTRIQNLKKIKFQSCQASRGTPHHLPTDSWTCLVLVLAVMIIFKTPVTFTYRSRAERPPPAWTKVKQTTEHRAANTWCLSTISVAFLFVMVRFPTSLARLYGLCPTSLRSWWLVTLDAHC